MSGTMRTILSFGQIVGLVRLYKIRIANEAQKNAEKLLVEGEGSFIRKLTLACNEYWKSVLTEKMDEANAFIIQKEAELQNASDESDEEKLRIDSEISASKKKLGSFERLVLRPSFTQSELSRFIPQDFYSQYDAMSSLNPINPNVFIDSLKSRFLGPDELLSSSYISELSELSLPDIKFKVGEDLKTVINDVLATRESKTKTESRSDSDLQKLLEGLYRSVPSRVKGSDYGKNDAFRDAARILSGFTNGKYNNLSKVLTTIKVDNKIGAKDLIDRLSDKVIIANYVDYAKKGKKTRFEDVIQGISQDALNAPEDSSIESAAEEDLRNNTSNSIDSAFKYFRRFINNRFKRGPAVSEVGGRGAQIYSSDIEAYADLMFQSGIDINKFDPVSDSFTAVFAELQSNPNYSFTRRKQERLPNLVRKIINNEKNRLVSVEGMPEAEAQKAAEQFLRDIKIEPSSSSAAKRTISDIIQTEEGESSIFDLTPAEGENPLDSSTGGIIDKGDNYDDFTTIMGRHMGPIRSYVIDAEYGDVPKIIRESLYKLIMDLNKATFKSDTSSVNTLAKNLATLVKQDSDYLSNKAIVMDPTKPDTLRDAKKALVKPIDDFFRGQKGKENIEDLIKKMSNYVWNYMNNNLTDNELNILARVWANDDPTDLLKGAFYSQGKKLVERTQQILEQGINDNPQDAIDKASELQEFNLLSILKKYRRLSPNENKRFFELERDLRTKRGVATPPREADYKYNDPVLQSIKHPDSELVKLKDVVRWTEWLAWAKKLSNPGDLPANEIDEDNEYYVYAKKLSKKLMDTGIPRASVFSVKPSSPIGERGGRLGDLERAMKSGKEISGEPPISLAEMTEISEEFAELAKKEKRGSIGDAERERLVDLAKKILGDRPDFINILSRPHATRRDDLPTTTVSRLLKTVPLFSQLLLQAKRSGLEPVVSTPITPEEIQSAEAWVKNRKNFRSAPAGDVYAKLRNIADGGGTQGVKYDKINSKQAEYLLEMVDGVHRINKIWEQVSNVKTSSALFWYSFAF